MIVSLRDQMQEDVLNVVLKVHEHAETCTYFPKGSAGRSVIAIVDEDRRVEQQTGGLVHVVRLQVLVARDSDDGIDTPQIGDSIRREDGADDELYSYTGGVLNADRDAWTLEFERRLPYALGGNRRQ